MADVMEILGEDRFRINSYRKVARVIGDTPADIENFLAAGKLAKMPGIGKSSLAKIEEFVKTGEITAHRELLAKIPPGLPQLLDIPGVGPKGVKAVYDKLNVTNIAELKAAIESGALAGLAGFGDKKAGFASIRLSERLRRSEVFCRTFRGCCESGPQARFADGPRRSATSTSSSAASTARRPKG